MTSRSRFLAAGALVAVAAAPQMIVAQPALVTLKLGATPSDDMTPIVYGMKAGVFARFGLEIELSKMTSGSAVAAGVLSGAFDLGKSSSTTLFEAYDKGVPFTMIAPSVVYDAKSPYVAFVVAKDAAITSARDLADKLIAVSALGDIGTIGMRAWVDLHGGDPKAIKFVEVPLGAAAAAVDEKRVFAAESSYPAMAAAVDSGKFRLFPALDAIGPIWLVAAWFTTRDSAARRPEVMRNFARAWAAAANFANANHAATVDLMADFTGVAAATIAKMPRAPLGITLQPSSIQPAIDAAVKYGGVKKSFPARELIDPSVQAL